MSEKGFSKEYWDVNYSEPQEMDGIGNANQHAIYAKSFFDVEFVHISSLIDFGFGLGFLFKAFCEQFIPYKVEGIEPSEHAFEKFNKDSLLFSPSTKVTLKKIGLVEWAKLSKPNSKRFDLGICTSVFQYLSDEEIKIVLPILAQRVRYLYFSVPTDKELKRQRQEHHFDDTYAIRRSREKYYELISPHFSFIGCRILESKIHFNDESTHFTDLLFRI